MTTTPDIREDLLQRLSALAPASVIVTPGVTRNAWSGPERPSSTTAGADVPLKAMFVHAATDTYLLHNDGRLRFFDMQVLIRGARLKEQETEALARVVHDALDLSGPFVGSTGGTRYMDVRALGGPIGLGSGASDAEYYAVNVQLWLDG